MTFFVHFYLLLRLLKSNSNKIKNHYEDNQKQKNHNENNQKPNKKKPNWKIQKLIECLAIAFSIIFSRNKNFFILLLNNPHILGNIVVLATVFIIVIKFNKFKNKFLVDFFFKKLRKLPLLKNINDKILRICIQIVIIVVFYFLFLSFLGGSPIKFVYEQLDWTTNKESMNEEEICKYIIEKLLNFFKLIKNKLHI